MKIFHLLFLSFLFFSSALFAQDNRIKLTDVSFAQTYTSLSNTKISETITKECHLELPKVDNFIWKRHLMPNYYNNHPQNFLCMNPPATEWELIRVRPVKHQVLYDAAAIGSGLLIGGLLEILSKQ